MIRFLLATLTAMISNQALAMDFSHSTVKVGSGHEINLVRMTGIIDPRDWMRFLGETAELDPSKDTLFTINSPGGNVQLGLFLIAKVDAYLAAQTQAGRKVAIAVEKDCSSMCVPLYYAFPNRFALSGSRIGLHAVSMGGIAYDPAMTGFYLDSLMKHADDRGDAKSKAFFSSVIAKGDFYSTELDPYRADDLAKQDSGLVTAAGLVSSESQLLQEM